MWTMHSEPSGRMLSSQMKRIKEAVVGSRQVHELLRARGSSAMGVEEAVSAGVIAREKLEGIWLYGSTPTALEDAHCIVEVEANHICSAWLLSPLPPLASAIAKDISTVSVSRDAVQPIVRSLLRSRHFGALGMLTQSYQPYLAVYRLEDAGEISRQLDYVQSCLSLTGVVSSRGLPNPLEERQFQAWRGNLLNHAEYTRLGYVSGQNLVGWGIS